MDDGENYDGSGGDANGKRELRHRRKCTASPNRDLRNIEKKNRKKEVDTSLSFRLEWLWKSRRAPSSEGGRYHGTTGCETQNTGGTHGPHQTAKRSVGPPGSF